LNRRDSKIPNSPRFFWDSRRENQLQGKASLPGQFAEDADLEKAVSGGIADRPFKADDDASACAAPFDPAPHAVRNRIAHDPVGNPRSPAGALRGDPSREMNHSYLSAVEKGLDHGLWEGGAKRRRPLA
jgi:hypothetical protein